MKSGPDMSGGERLEKDSKGRGAAPACNIPPEGEMDLSLLDESLTKTPWERMQANDDALRFGELLSGAMERRNAES